MSARVQRLVLVDGITAVVVNARLVGGSVVADLVDVEDREIARLYRAVVEQSGIPPAEAAAILDGYTVGRAATDVGVLA